MKASYISFSVDSVVSYFRLVDMGTLKPDRMMTVIYEESEFHTITCVMN